MKKLVTCIVLLVCINGVMMTSVNAESNHLKLTKVNEKIKKNKAALTPKIKEKKKTEKVLNKLNKQIKFNETKLSEAKQKLKQAVSNEKRAKKELVSIEKKYKQVQEKLKKRLTHLYKFNPLGSIEVLLSSNNLITDTETTFFFDKILNQDIELIDSVKKEFNEIKEKRKELREQTTQKLILKQEIEDHKTILSKRKIQKKQSLKEIETQIDNLIRQNKELQSLSKDLTNLINQEKGEGYLGTGAFIKPVKGWISSKFGMRKHPIFKRNIKHTGIDIAAPKGYKIRAADSGKVIFAGTKGGYGKSVLIYHGKRQSDKKTLSTFYAHQSRIFVKKGDFVRKGEEIGLVGATGYATGPHLHFEVKLDGTQVDPLLFIK